MTSPSVEFEFGASCYFNIAKVKQKLHRHIVKQLIHTLIFSCLEYCNTCLIDAAVVHLQLVQNTAAKLLISTWHRKHFTPVLDEPYWLCICYKIQFKFLLIAFKSLRALTSLYISEMLTLNSALGPLGSENHICI